MSPAASSVVPADTLAGTSAATPVLQVRHVTKTFPNVRALSDVSLDVRGGEILAVMGENGAGKSTLLKILNGTYVPDGGSLALAGREVRFASTRESRAAGLRVVAQEPDIATGLSVAENVFLGELPLRFGRFVDRRTLATRTRELLDTFRYGARIDPRMPASELTPPQRQMIEILRALRPGLRVLALDEPTSSLSDAEADDLFAVVRRLRDEGVALIYVSHRMHEILGLVDRVAVLRDGILVGTRPVVELDHAMLIRMMVGRTLEASTRTARTVDRPPRLVARGITSSAVTDVNLEVRPGEVVGLAGLVGAGRTALAKTLFGEMPMSGGTLEIDGRPVRPRSPRDAVRAGIAYVPEERKAEALFLERSVAENAAVATLGARTRLRFVDARAERDAVTRSSASMRVKTPSLEQPIGKLSGGNQQKVVLARWIMAEPKVIVLDEPTRGIDVGAKGEIYALIDRMAMDGRAVIVISSEMLELLAVSDRIVCMNGGHIVGELPTGDANEERLLEICMREPRSTVPDAAHRSRA